MIMTSNNNNLSHNYNVTIIKALTGIMRKTVLIKK